MADMAHRLSGPQKKKNWPIELLCLPAVTTMYVFLHSQFAHQYYIGIDESKRCSSLGSLLLELAK